jgi:tRNA nucleotidyltransferase (CCA-adding enzyme)
VKRRLFLACALTPFAGVSYTDAKGRSNPAVELAIREGLKIGAKNHYLDGIPALFLAAGKLREPRLESDRLEQSDERVAIGQFLSFNFTK